MTLINEIQHSAVELHKICRINEAPSSVPTPTTSSEKVKRRKDLTEKEKEEISNMSHPSQMPYKAAKLKSPQIYWLEISNTTLLLSFINTDNMVLRCSEERKRQYAALRRAIFRDAPPGLVAKFSLCGDKERLPVLVFSILNTTWKETKSICQINLSGPPCH